MEPQTPSKSKNHVSGLTHICRSRKLVVLSVLMILVLGGFCGYLIYKKHFVMPKKMYTYFTVVLDCGSTGSRVNVFEWVIENQTSVNGDLPVLLRSFPNNEDKSNGCEYHCLQTEPGLHNFVNNVSGVRESLEPLIRYAERWVPLESRGTTPIFVLGTAGMRRLVAEDATQILEDAKNVVRGHGFLYKKNWIRVLSGKEEAYYGWVALNYKMGAFGDSSRSTTLGLLDLGGSSLQVVAEVDSSVKDEHVFRSKIGPVEHDIVAYSFSAFGLNEAFDRTVIILSRTQTIGERADRVFKVRHPCLGSGFIQNYTCRGCFGMDSVMTRNSDNQVQEVSLVGEPNWKRCEGIARAAAINSSASEWLKQHYHSNCIGLFSYGGNTTLNLTKSLHYVSRYHALSGFFAVYHALNLSQTANLTMLWESGKKLWSRSMHDPKSFHGQDCFRVPYLASLIENTLCLSSTEIIFGPGDVAWTLGASLIEGEFLWHHAGPSVNDIFVLKDGIIISSPLLTFAVLMSLLLVAHFCQIKLPIMGGRKSGTRTSMSSYKNQAS